MKRTKGEYIFQAFNTIFMILLCVIMIYPYLNQVAVSFNEGTDAMMGGISIFPRKFTLANYAAIFSNQSIPRAALISVSKVLLGTLISLVVLFTCAYGITRANLPYRRAITLYLMIPCYISAGVVPTYIIYRYLGLINNYSQHASRFTIWLFCVPSCRKCRQALKNRQSLTVLTIYR